MFIFGIHDPFTPLAWWLHCCGPAPPYLNARLSPSLAQSPKRRTH